MIASTRYNKNIKSAEEKKILFEALNGKHTISKAEEILKGIKSRSSSFLSPVVQEKVVLSDNVALVKSLWFDDLVELPKKNDESVTKSFESDEMVHRQYCILHVPGLWVGHRSHA